MSKYDGEDLHNYLCSCQQPRTKTPESADDYTNSRYHEHSPDGDQKKKTSRNRRKGLERAMKLEWDRERDRNKNRHHERKERTRDRKEDDSYESPDYSRGKEYDGYRRSEHRSRSRSSSCSKTKRIGGFAIVPHLSASIPGATPVPGQIPACVPAVPGATSPNMFSMAPMQNGVLPAHAVTQQATRHARRVYVGGLPPGANEQSVVTFFSHVMSAIGGNSTAGPGDAVINVYINHEHNFAFVEMRSVEEASNAMALDGIIFRGSPVKVKRPTDYNPYIAATLGPTQPNPNLNLAAVGLIPGSASVLNSPDRIFMGGLPNYFKEAQVRELLELFGPLRRFVLVKDRKTGNSKGYAFCIYQNLSVTDIACAALNGIKLGDKTLTVRRAYNNQEALEAKPEQESAELLNAKQQIALPKAQRGAPATKILCLLKVVSADELKNNETYQDIMEDITEECKSVGNLVNVFIPRPNPNGEPAPGVGNVFLEYADVENAITARLELQRRKFNKNQVIAVFYPENKFSQGDYEGYANSQLSHSCATC